MRLVALQESESGLSALVEQAQQERVLLTKDGRPVAVLIGVEGQDPEAVRLAADARAWRWLEGRGRGPATICLT
jgi:prevent-host-death family protein